MIVLHTGDEAEGRVARLAAGAAAAYRADPAVPLADQLDAIGAWLRGAADGALIAVVAARAGTAAERRALRSLRGMVKVKGVDLHLVGGADLEPIADRVVAGDADLDEASGAETAAIAARLQAETMTPLVRARATPPSWQEIMAAAGVDEAEARRKAAWMAAQAIWVNNLYQVNVEEVSDEIVHLIIRRLDKQPIHNWQHFQQIKTQLLGAECEAVELYPPESRLVDEKHHYHLWGYRAPGRSFGVGFDVGRKVRT